MRTKSTAIEDRTYASINHIVKLDWLENDSKAWGGFQPHVTVEYDENTGHLLFVTIRYNKRIASKYVRTTTRTTMFALVTRGEDLFAICSGPLD